MILRRSMYDKEYPLIFTEDGTTYVLKTHSATLCEGQPCVVHNPSKHHMANWPMNWREDRYMMERLCEHGVGHPDPDHIWFIRNKYGVDMASTESVHGCDGCCASGH